jgi:transposase
VSIVDVAILLPHLAGLHLDRVYLKRVRVRIEARTRADLVRCPDCSVASARVHSRYPRQLADAGIGRREMTLSLTVPRLFCNQPGCACRTFAEQAPRSTTRQRPSLPPAGQPGLARKERRQTCRSL